MKPRTLLALALCLPAPAVSAQVPSTNSPAPTISEGASTGGKPARTTAVPIDVSLAGGLGGSANAIPFPACALALKDQDGSGCLQASSEPTLGMLYPLSGHFFVDNTGFVGIGTTNPTARLQVNGDLRFQDDDGTIKFPNASGATSPMMEMFTGGGGNADRMVLAHSTGALEWGLKYSDGFDRFIFQQLNSSPVFTVDLFTKDLTVHDGSLKIVNTDSSLSNLTLDVGQVSTNAFRVANIERIGFNQVDYDVLQLKVPFGSDLTSQYIEAEDNTDIEFRVNVGGTVYADGAYTGPADFAEMIQVTSGAESVEPGDVLVIDPASARGVRRSSSAYSTLVAGIFSTNPGFVGSEREWEEIESTSLAADAERKTLDRSDMAQLYDEVPVAVVGIVPCKVSAENGPIQPGDLLVTSATPGHAMRDGDPRTGTVVGKALEPLAAGMGTIRVLVTLQ